MGLRKFANDPSVATDGLLSHLELGCPGDLDEQALRLLALADSHDAGRVRAEAANDKAIDAPGDVGMQRLGPPEGAWMLFFPRPYSRIFFPS